jgi:hypothetical protein
MFLVLLKGRRYEVNGFELTSVAIVEYGDEHYKELSEDTSFLTEYMDFIIKIRMILMDCIVSM